MAQNFDLSGLIAHNGLVFGRDGSGPYYMYANGQVYPICGAYGVAEYLQTSVGSFTFTGPAGRFSLNNHQGVQFPLLANMPAFGGARPVVNWFLNSSTPGSPTAWDLLAGTEVADTAVLDTYNSATVGALNIQVNGTSQGPTERAYSGTSFGATLVASPYAPGQWAKVNAWPPGTMMSVRLTVRNVDAQTSWQVYQRARDDALAPTESCSGNVTLTTSYQTIAGLMEQSAAYQALATSFQTAGAGSGNARVTQVQLEDLSGDTGPLIPSEVVPAGASPTWRWFSYGKGTSVPSLTYMATWATSVAIKTPGVSQTASVQVLSDGQGAGLNNLTGLLMEPAASNLCSGSNTLANIGQAKGSGVLQAPATNGVAPFRSGNTTVQLEAFSGMMVGNYNGTAPTDITCTLNGVSAGNDSLDSTTTNFLTAGFFVGMTIWVWRNDTLTFGPMPVTAVTATKVSLSGTYFGVTRASGVGTRIFRCPGNGDNIMLLLNNGTSHRTTLSSAVTIPTAAQFNASNKAGLVFTVAAAPPSDGGWASTDNGVHCFYWKDHTDFGISIAGGTGVTCKPVFDRMALINAGLGYVSPMGLALEIYGGSGATTTVALGNTSSLGTAGRDTRISVWAKKISGTTMNVKLENGAHLATTALSGSSWTRYTCAETSLGAQNIPTISNVAAGSTTYVFLWMTEQASNVPANQTGVTSSAIVTVGATAAVTRSATRCTRVWQGSYNDGFVRTLQWTPTQGALVQQQVLWSLRADASNYYELSIANTTITLRKRRAATNTDATASYTPVIGTTVRLKWSFDTTYGLRLWINDVLSASSTSDLFPITAMTAAAVEDIGSNNGSNVAYGYFKGLGVQ